MVLHTVLKYLFHIFHIQAFAMQLQLQSCLVDYGQFSLKRILPIILTLTQRWTYEQMQKPLWKSTILTNMV